MKRIKGLIKAEYNEVVHLKMSYQEELVLLVKKLSNVKNLKSQVNRAWKRSKRRRERFGRAVIFWGSFICCNQDTEVVKDEMKEREKLRSEEL